MRCVFDGVNPKPVKWYRAAMMHLKSLIYHRHWNRDVNEEHPDRGDRMVQLQDKTGAYDETVRYK